MIKGIYIFLEKYAWKVEISPFTCISLYVIMPPHMLVWCYAWSYVGNLYYHVKTVYQHTKTRNSETETFQLNEQVGWYKWHNLIRETCLVKERCRVVKVSSSPNWKLPLLTVHLNPLSWNWDHLTDEANTFRELDVKMWDDGKCWLLLAYHLQEILGERNKLASLKVERTQKQLVKKCSSQSLITKKPRTWSIR